MYDAYLFDLYGTLVDIHTDEESIEAWRKLSVFYGYYGAEYQPEELKAAYREEEALMREHARKGTDSVHNSDEHPEIVLEYVFQRLFQRKGIDATLELSIHTGQFFRVLTLQYIKRYRGITTLLSNLKENGSRIYLLSNAQRIFTDHEMSYLHIKQFFDGILYSSDAGYMKPDKRFYQAALEQFSIDPRRSIMIGNDYTCDILGAKNVGLEAFYVHTNLSPKMPEDMENTAWMRGMDGEELIRKIGKG